MSIETIFLESALKEFRDYKSLADKTFAQLTGDEMHMQPNDECNSIAITIQHMHGNMLSRWTNFLTEDGEKEWRVRDDEFEKQALPKDQLLALWEEGWKVALNTLASLGPDDLLKTIYIRSKPHSVAGAINRQLTHYSYHAGQIVLLGKWIKGSAWQTLSIPRGGSAMFNRNITGK